MDTLEAIFSRRSIRKYSPGKIEADQIEQILKAAMYAPTARNYQTWRFVVVDERNDLKELSTIHPYGKMLAQASAAIMVCGDKTIEPMEGYLVQNAAASTQNLLLACHALGLGAVWLGVYPRSQRMKDLSSWFGLPEHIMPIALVSIGFPDEAKPMPQRWDSSKVRYGRW